MTLTLTGLKVILVIRFPWINGIILDIEVYDRLDNILVDHFSVGAKEPAHSKYKYMYGMILNALKEILGL